MSEEVLPGVTITEVDEGLLGTPSPGAIGVLLVGTAAKGPITPQFFGSDQLPNLIEMYGSPDPYSYKSPTGNEPPAELTLTRAAQQVFNGGPPAGGLWVQRATEGSVVTGVGNGMTIETAVPVDDGFFVFTAKYPGQWYNNFKFEVQRGKDQNGAADTGLITIKFQIPSSVFYDSYLGASPASALVSTYRWFGQTYVMEIGTPGLATEPTLAEILQAFKDDAVMSSYFNFASNTVAGVRPKDTVGFVNLFVNIVKESGSDGVSVISTGNFSSAGSTFLANGVYPGDKLIITGGTGGGDNGTYTVLTVPTETSMTVSPNFPAGDTVVVFTVERNDVGGTNWSADDSAIITAASIKTALDQLLVKSGRIAIIGGADETVLSGTYFTEGVNHVLAASVAGSDRESLYICGTGNYTTESALIAAFEASPYPLSQIRAAHVTPGIKYANAFAGKIYGELTFEDIEATEMLSGGYAAAFIAGLLSQTAPTESILNKSINVLGLEFEFGRTAKMRAVNASFITLSKGFDGAPTVIKAITSAGKLSAWYQLSNRMAADEIRYALRLASLPFIGRKNNARVRAILQEKLDSVLNGYTALGVEVINPNYSVEVTATRQQEINGVVVVTAIIQLVQYMEFIKITLVLE